MAESGLSASELALKVPHADAQDVEAWMTETATLTRVQLDSVSKALRRPGSIFFLPQPPRRSSVPADLRTAKGRGTRQLEPGELRQLRRARRVQRIIRWIQSETTDTTVDLPSVQVNADPAQTGQTLRAWSHVNVQDQLRWRNPKNAFDTMRSAFEEQGVVVLQLQLGKRGIRGFSLLDDRVPLIAVTTAENLQARLFTLFHEFAHIASRSESSCLPISVASKTASTERWCDEVASAALLPRADLQDVAHRVRVSPRAPVDDVDWVRRVAGRFSVSLRATAVAMIRAGMLEPGSYNDIELAAPVSDAERGFAPGQGGQRAPERRLGEFGRWSSRLILRSLNDNLITEVDARRYLRLDGDEIGDLADAVGMSR